MAGLDAVLPFFEQGSFTRGTHIRGVTEREYDLIAHLSSEQKTLILQAKSSGSSDPLHEPEGVVADRETVTYTGDQSTRDEKWVGMLRSILSSEDDVAKSAITRNLEAFDKLVHLAQIGEMYDEVVSLRRELESLKGRTSQPEGGSSEVQEGHVATGGKRRKRAS